MAGGAWPKASAGASPNSRHTHPRFIATAAAFHTTAAAATLGFSPLAYWDTPPSSLGRALDPGSLYKSHVPNLSDARRTASCLLGAVVLHGSATLLGSCEREARARSTPVAFSTQSALLLPIEVEMPKPDLGPAPGGGSPEPLPDGPERRSPEQPSVTVEPAPKVALAKSENDIPELSEQVSERPRETDSAAVDLVTQASSHAPMTAGTRTQVEPSERRTATATRVAPQQSALSAYKGSGLGAKGGPGGRGAGWGRGKGLVQRRFAFGGPSGAFRAEVCFISSSTKSLRDVRSCAPVVTFYTDELNVPPRSFTAGFPGVTTRTEWFAIDYRGTFQVRAADYYEFRLISDDGALLFIDGHLIIDNDGQHPPAIKEATIPLAAGPHRLKVSYYQGPRDRIALQLFVTGSDGVQRLLGPEI